MSGEHTPPTASGGGCLPGGFGAAADQGGTPLPVDFAGGPFDFGGGVVVGLGRTDEIGFDGTGGVVIV
jgi:hypothetical protein